MNHDYCKHKESVCVNALMPLLDAAPEHKEDEDLEICHEVGPTRKRRVVATVVHKGSVKDYQSDRIQTFLISPLRFVRVVRGIMEEMGQYHFTFQYAAMQVLQLAAETHVAQSFADGLLLAYHAKRMVARVDVTRLARRLQVA